jgi:hemerythrin
MADLICHLVQISKNGVSLILAFQLPEGRKTRFCILLLVLNSAKEFSMIEWNEEHSVGISVIDEEHKKFINIINRVVIAELHNSNLQIIEKLLHEIIDYACNHFKIEERYMIEFDYQEYQCHKEEHMEFVLKSIDYLNRVTSGDCHIANEILEYLKQWLVKHIQGTDQKYIECFISNGLK